MSIPLDVSIVLRFEFLSILFVAEDGILTERSTIVVY